MTIITGKNGAGKSALLFALSEGFAVAQLGSKDLRNPSLLTSETIQSAVSHAKAAEEGASRGAKTVLDSLKQDFLKCMAGLSEPEKRTLETLIENKDMDALQKLVEKPKYRAFAKHIFGSDVHDPGSLMGRTAQLKKKPWISLTDVDLDESHMWGKASLFGDGLSQPFLVYQRLQLENALRQLRSKNVPHEPFLSDKEFREEHGPPPWEMINKALEHAGLPYEYESPDLAIKPQPPTLQSKLDGRSISVSDLSSGERTLFALAHCLFNGTNHKGAISRPALMLLDEVDAFLHPEMIRRYMNVIDDFLVKNARIPVIAVTHSPSTIALAPEGSVHVLERGGALRAVSKGTALNILTEGVPTLAIDYEGRRQVFVESPSDAGVYSAIYRVFKRELDSERSLEFIAVGQRDEKTGQEKDGGCANLSRVVSALDEGGNKTAFGLIDWDGKNKAEGRIEVLAPETRYAIENVIFDPLLVAAALCVLHDHEDDVGLERKTSLNDFKDFPEAKLQDIVNQVQQKILGDGLTETNTVQYFGGLQLDIDKRCLRTGKHEWEDKVIKAFPALNRLGRTRAKIVEQVVDRVIAEAKAFFPVDALDTLRGLLNRDVHDG